MNEREPLGFREMGSRTTSENDFWRRIAWEREQRLWEALNVIGLTDLSPKDPEVEKTCGLLLDLMGVWDSWRDEDVILEERKFDMLGIILTVKRSIKAGSKPVQWITAEADDERFVCATLPRTMEGGYIIRTTSMKFYDRLKIAAMMVKD